MQLNPSCLRHLLPRSWREGPFSPHLRILLVTTLLFLLLKITGAYSGLDPAAQIPILLMLAWLTKDLRMQDATPAFTLLMRTIIGFFTLFMVFTYPAVTDTAVAPWSYEWFMLHWGRAIAVIAGIIAWYRPGAALILLCLVAWYKNTLQSVLGLVISKTDYYSVLEFGVFMVLGLFTAKILPKYWHWIKAEPASSSGETASRTQWRYADVIVLGAIAIHLANYFYSAVEKLLLDGGPLSWVLENDTHNIMMAAHLQGTLPLLINDTLVQWAHIIVSHGVLPINILTLLGQAFAILALRRISWAIGITLFYDLTHIIIFLVSGIFFWKWIILNFAIVAALLYLRHKVVPNALAIPLMGMTALAPLVFFVTFLGWYDAASLSRVTITAHMNDGRTLDVPSNYFLTNSVVFGQQRVGFPYAGHFPLGSFGSTSNGEIWRKGDACQLSTDPEQFFLRNQEHAEKVRKAVLTPHRYILERVSPNGRYKYDLYPHHIWSNPFHYWEFLWADKRDIQSFTFMVESLCMSLDNEGQVQTDVKHTSRFAIPVE